MLVFAVTGLILSLFLGSIGLGLLHGFADRSASDSPHSLSGQASSFVKGPLSLIPISAVVGKVSVARAADAPTAEPSQVRNFEHPDWAVEMLHAVNALRREEGVAPLELCATLGFAASRYSETMATHQWLLHEGPDGSLPIDRVRSVGFRGLKVAENIATGFTSAPAALRAFMVSASHRAAILDSEHRYAGFGTDQGYWTQYFGSGSNC